MTVPVHRATRRRNIRHTGRIRAAVPTTAQTSPGAHPPHPHQSPSATAPAHSAGITMLTAVTTHARTNPTQAPTTHDLTRRTLFLPMSWPRPGSRGFRDARPAHRSTVHQ